MGVSSGELDGEVFFFFGDGVEFSILLIFAVVMVPVLSHVNGSMVMPAAGLDESIVSQKAAALSPLWLLSFSSCIKKQSNNCPH